MVTQISRHDFLQNIAAASTQMILPSGMGWIRKKHDGRVEEDREVEKRRNMRAEH